MNTAVKISLTLATAWVVGNLIGAIAYAITINDYHATDRGPSVVAAKELRVQKYEGLQLPNYKFIQPAEPVQDAGQLKEQ